MSQGKVLINGELVIKWGYSAANTGWETFVPPLSSLQRPIIDFPTRVFEETSFFSQEFVSLRGSRWVEAPSYCGRYEAISRAPLETKVFCFISVLIQFNISILWTRFDLLQKTIRPVEDILATHNEDGWSPARSKYLEQLISPVGKNIALDLRQTFPLKLPAPPFA